MPAVTCTARYPVSVPDASLVLVVVVVVVVVVMVVVMDGYLYV